MNANRRIELIAAVAATLALLACSDSVSVAIAQRQQFEPPEEYRSWWETVEACSSRSGDFDLVRWFDTASIVVQGVVVSGLWEPPHDITLWSLATENASVVRHEILHDLLRGDGDHKDDAWSLCNLGTQGSAEVA